MKQPLEYILTVEEIVEHFGVSAGAVRAWIAAGRLEPVRREGQGRGGRAWYAAGEVSELVFGVCPGCGGGFRRERLGQRFCSRRCRDRHRRLHGGK